MEGGCAEMPVHLPAPHGAPKESCRAGATRDTSHVIKMVSAMGGGVGKAEDQGVPWGFCGEAVTVASLCPPMTVGSAGITLRSLSQWDGAGGCSPSCRNCSPSALAECAYCGGHSAP